MSGLKSDVIDPQAANGKDAGSPPTDHHGPAPNRLWLLVLGSIGVVYGDIGTSPLYALRESLSGAARDGLTNTEVIGIVSVLLWTLILIVSLKYVVLILRADNRGEGGTLSLVALTQSSLGRRTAPILVLGVLGTALFFGDAIITPAISVLSAVEGLKLVAPGFETFVIPLTLAIILALFWVQDRGTEKVAVFFGPITLLFFITIGTLGAVHVGDQAQILYAFNPINGLAFVFSHGSDALPVMGSVFLAVTGAEALYADMGHFGRRPIRIAWAWVVFPALTLSYLGQGALVLSQPEALENPFYLLAPDWMLLPLVILATAATVIASQAVITGAFSLTQQAVQMGLLPRMELVHTSKNHRGQIFMPGVNRALLVGVVVLVLGFRNSSSLASAYGIAVTGTMVTTTLLAAVVFRRNWGWSAGLVALICGPLLLIESMFLIANLQKVADGGWVPLALALAVGAAIFVWVQGTRHVQGKARNAAVGLNALIDRLGTSRQLSEAPGTAVFLTSDPETAPSALLHNLKHNNVLHRKNYIVTVTVANTPYVADTERVRLEKINDRFAKVSMSFGYMEQPNVPRALTTIRKMGEKFDIMSTSFFLNRRSFRPSARDGLPPWQERIYVTMAKSAANATDFYQLPTNRVIELGQQLSI